MKIAVPLLDLTPAVTNPPWPHHWAGDILGHRPYDNRGLDASAVLNERARLELLAVTGVPAKNEKI